MSTDPERRKFLKQGSAGLGALIAAPRAGLLGLLGAAAVGAAARGNADSSSGTAVAPGAPPWLIRSGEPINSRGEPFGYSIAGMAQIAPPALDSGGRWLVVVAHDRARESGLSYVADTSVGVSVLEIARDARGAWRHEVASHHNRRWHRGTPVPLDGARLGADGKLSRVQEEGEGLGPTAVAVPTPWFSALCLERGGWVVEVQPVSGLAMRRFSLGRMGATQLRLVAELGKPVVVYALGRSLYKFVSHQQFDPRLVRAGGGSLLIGELHAADLSGRRWVALTPNADVEAWKCAMRDPGAAAERAGVAAVDPAFDLERLRDGGDTFEVAAPREAVSEPRVFGSRALEDGVALIVS